MLSETCPHIPGFGMKPETSLYIESPPNLRSMKPSSAGSTAPSPKQAAKPKAAKKSKAKKPGSKSKSEPKA